MNLPTLTAEASLYRSGSTYRTGFYKASADDKAGLQLARFVGNCPPGWIWVCNWGFGWGFCYCERLWQVQLLPGL
ncbi:MAG: hypothetical protein JO110_19910 [Acetobacteraceae bacterium]|nr:hypothetical protein [Acetobacteraceae bacterium]